MISIQELVQTAGWRKFMAKLYGWGASVVLIGALAKLQHWAWAGPALIVGMSTEAIIFFFSAFEPQHEEVDWSIVYPELAGIEEDPEEARERNRARREAMEGFASAAGAGGGSIAGAAPGAGAGEETAQTGGTGVSAGAGGAINKLNEMLENADISPELFEQLSDGLKKLNETTKNISEVSDASIATNQYVDNLQAASESINYLTETYNKSNNDLSQSIEELSGIYRESAERIKESGKNMADQMEEGGKSFAERVKESGDDLSNAYKDISDNVRSSVTQENNTFNEKLEEMNKNLSALNAAYELQLKNTNEHVKTTQGIYGEMDHIMKDLRASVDETEKYREEISKLNQNLEELNSVYGNMLSAMSVMNNNS
jgi:gliding motility-associated protein GldL